MVSGILLVLTRILLFMRSLGLLILAFARFPNDYEGIADEGIAGFWYAQRIKIYTCTYMHACTGDPEIHLPLLEYIQCSTYMRRVVPDETLIRGVLSISHLITIRVRWPPGQP